MSDKAKNWIRLFWYGGFFLLAIYCSTKAHGWGYALWLVAGGLFYQQASTAFDRL
jgi:hypothetical protein